MQHTIAVLLFFLLSFTAQSLSTMFRRRGLLMKLLPLVLFIAPLSCIADTARLPIVTLHESALMWMDFLIPVLLGNLIGCITGIRFRHMLDEDRKAAGEASSGGDSADAGKNDPSVSRTEDSED